LILADGSGDFILSKGHNTRFLECQLSELVHYVSDGRAR
jgi:hypothetical protein